jgi:hypothetical protein
MIRKHDAEKAAEKEAIIRKHQGKVDYLECAQKKKKKKKKTCSNTLGGA